MINIVKIISSRIENAQRLITLLRYGRSDVREVLEVMPYGEDSVPIENLRGIYAETGEKGKKVLLGYINKNQLSNPGEKRIFSTDADGNLAIAFHLKNDGTAELGGSVDNLIRFSSLNSSLIQQANDINVELAKIAVAINAIVPNSYTPTPITINIDQSKIDQLKTS